MYSSTQNSANSSDDSPSKNRTNLSDCTGTNPKFRFPPQNRLFHSADSSCGSSQSERSNSPSVYSKKTKRKNKKKLASIGIFWDIENCQIPKNKSASAVVQRIREFFLSDYREAEFLVVCDVKKERAQIIQELHDSQVNVIHVASTSKNAADEKLRQSLRRFAEVHRPPCCVVLISSDINFAGDLSDLRYRKKIRVVLVHNSNVADALILCANQHYDYSAITEGLPSEKYKAQKCNEEAFLWVSNLPKNLGASTIKNRLSFLTNNCGGKVVEVVRDEGCAFIKFCNQDFANRAQKRIQGEDVFGNKIKAVTPAIRSYTGKKVNGDTFHQSSPGYLTPRQHAPDFDGPGTSGLMDVNLRGASRRFRTPQDTGRVHRTSGSSDFSDDSQKSNEKPVSLIISNLDPTVGNLNHVLTNLIQEYAVILSLKVYSQREGQPCALLKVLSRSMAKLLISQLHRQKVGHKRISISYAQNNLPDLDHLRAMVIYLLQGAPDNAMPLFKLLKLLEARYRYTVSLNEINKLKDVCKIGDSFGSRIISLATEYKASPPPNLSQVSVPYCTLHCAHGPPNLGWGEMGPAQDLNLMIPLEIFTMKLHSLLDLHMGCMHLFTFQVCYEKEFGQRLPVDSEGVPLEHLISCVSNVKIKWTGPSNNIKVIGRGSPADEPDEEEVLKSVPPQLAHKISLFSREVVDLLKTTDKCQIPLSKFIPAYHHHFGRQCHVADYGHTKLLDLLESIPHVAQLMGDSLKKVLTLSHPSQMRRFTSDLLRVLKVQPFKQLKMDDYAAAYEKVMNKSFNPVHYGLCTIRDLLKEGAENVVVITQNDDDGCLVISVPKREQTAQERAKTQQFAKEVVEILRHSQNYTMLFNQFVPAYHHNFGHQCRVSDYGFSKLVELFEAIPDVVKVNQLADGERTVSLAVPLARKILGCQLRALAESNSLYLENLQELYMEEYGHQLRPYVYECADASELVANLSDFVEIVMERRFGLHMIFPVEYTSKLKIRAWALLLDPPHQRELDDFRGELERRCAFDLPHDYLSHLRDVVSPSERQDANVVTLTDGYKMAAELYHFLYAMGDGVLFGDLEIQYRRRYWKNLNLISYDIRTVDDLYRKFGFLFDVNDSQKEVLALNRDLAKFEVPLPADSSKKWSQAPLRVMQLKKDSLLAKSFENSPRSSVWDVSSPPEKSFSPCLNIQLPLDSNPRYMRDPFDLISPARTLCPHNLWGISPEPTKLPIPDKLMLKKGTEDSGVKMESSSLMDHDLSSSAAGPINNNVKKREFRSFLSFEN